MSDRRIPEPSSRDAMISFGVRTPFGKSKTAKREGILSKYRPEEVAAIALNHAYMSFIDSGWGAPPHVISDVILGCVAGEGPQGYNIARIAARGAGMLDHIPSQTVNRMCASGMEAISIGANKISAGQAGVVFAGGVECMSWVPMGIRAEDGDALPLAAIGANFDPHPQYVVKSPESYIATILAAELTAFEFGISRADQDAFAAESHRRAIECQKVQPLEMLTVNGWRKDEGPREDSTAEKLSQLKPLLHQLYTPERAAEFTGLNGCMSRIYPNASVTAGNASQTTDGAAVLVLEPRSVQIPPFGVRIVDYVVSGVSPEKFPIAPVYAIQALCWRNGLRVSDIDLFEINEAFAAQVLADVRELAKNAFMDEGRLLERTNVNGGAIAIGHPLGASGARLVLTLANQLKSAKKELGIASLCVGGGMGAAMLLQNESV